MLSSRRSLPNCGVIVKGAPLGCGRPRRGHTVLLKRFDPVKRTLLGFAFDGQRGGCSGVEGFRAHSSRWLGRWNVDKNKSLEKLLGRASPVSLSASSLYVFQLLPPPRVPYRASGPIMPVGGNPPAGASGLNVLRSAGSRSRCRPRKPVAALARGRGGRANGQGGSCSLGSASLEGETRRLAIDYS